jgi:hypothetical protein
MRLVLPFLLMLTLAACASRPSPPPEPNPANPLARAAVEEWRIWGRIVIEGWPDQRPPDTAATAGRVARLAEYWSSLPGGWRIAQHHQDLRLGIATLEARLAAAGEESEARPMPQASIDDLAYYANPAWSAVFISAVARLAGMPEEDLPSASRHFRYVDAILDRAMRDPQHAPFTPHAPGDQAPAPGDLLCADRAWVQMSHWTERLAERGRPRPMHCDVVVRAMPGTVEAIGGNVQGTVALRRFPADRAGRVLSAPYDRPGFILLLAARQPPPG